MFGLFVGGYCVSLLLLATLHLSGPVEDGFHIESWKKGSTRIEEGMTLIDLSCQPHERHFESVVKDANGRDKYKLLVEPATECSGGRTFGWAVGLLELGETDLGRNLLRPSPGASDFVGPSADAHFFLALTQTATAKGDGVVGLWQARIFHIEGFYCILSVIDATISDDDPSLMGTLKLRIEFTNELK